MHIGNVDLRTLTPATQLSGECPEDTRLLFDALAKAERFMLSHGWCRRIVSSHFGLGIGCIVASFLFEIEGTRDEIDPLLWVIVGDLPSAYLVTDVAPDPASALEAYIELMQDWVSAVEQGADLDEVFPVEAAPTARNATSLKTRLGYLRDDILPEWREVAAQRAGTQE